MSNNHAHSKAINRLGNGASSEFSMILRHSALARRLLRGHAEDGDAPLPPVQHGALAPSARPSAATRRATCASVAIPRTIFGRVN